MPREALRSGLVAKTAGHPFLVVVAALAVGVALAKLIDWRSHAHPRD